MYETVAIHIHVIAKFDGVFVGLGLLIHAAESEFNHIIESDLAPIALHNHSLSQDLSKILIAIVVATLVVARYNSDAIAFGQVQDLPLHINPRSPAHPC